MQFDYEFEDENDNFSLDDDDSGAISWQDLLSDEEVNKKLAENKEKKANSISNFDISTVQDDLLESDSTNAQQVGATAQNVEADDGFGYDDDSSLLDESNDANIKLDDSQVSNVLDDELLNLLNDKEEGDEEEEEEYAEPEIVNNEQIEEKALQSIEYEAYSDGQDDTQNIEDNGYDADVNDYQTEDIVPNAKKKSAKPVLALAFLMIIVAVVAFGYFIFSNSVETSVDIENAPIASDANEVQTDEDDLAITRQQAKEIEDKEKAENPDKIPSFEGPKKVVVNVPLEGRRNPFVPSSLFNDEGLTSIGADFSSVPDINPDDPEAMEARKLFSISVSGIMYDPAKPSAILRFDEKDYFVQKGDRIDTYTVCQITKDYVAIRNAANVYKAYVGESFAIESSNIPSSQQMKLRNGQRQYISSEDVKINVK